MAADYTQARCQARILRVPSEKFRASTERSKKPISRLVSKFVGGRMLNLKGEVSRADGEDDRLMSTLPVVEQILRETRVPMSVREIVEYAKGRLPTKSKTPDTVVARDLSMDIKRKGDASLFARTSPGRYTMRSYAEERRAPQATDTTTSVIASAIKRERVGTLPAATAPSVSAEQQSATSSSR